MTQDQQPKQNPLLRLWTWLSLRTSLSGSSKRPPSPSHDLRHSVVLGRTFVLLIVTILFSSGLMMLWTSFMSEHFRNRQLIEDLGRRASLLAQETSYLEEGNQSGMVYRNLLRVLPSFLETNVMIDLDKEVNWRRLHSQYPSEFSEEELLEIENLLGERNNQFVDNRPLAFYEQIGDSKKKVLFVAAPILIRDQQGIVYQAGQVYLFQTMPLLASGLLPLLLSFFASLCLTLTMMSLPAFYFIRLMVRPLFNIRDVAKNLSEGDFSKKVDTNYKAEFGELALSINQMADKLQQTIKNLEKESLRLRQIINGLNEGILAFSARLELTHMNPTFRSFFPQCREARLHSPLYTLQIPSIQEEIERAIQSNENQFFTIRRQDRILSGQVLLLESTDGLLQGVIVLFRDVTEEMRLEQTRRDYVSNVSHELKTPLTALRCMVEPLLDGLIQKPEDVQRYYNLIYDETLRMARLIDDMLELSRLQTGGTHIPLDELPLLPLLRSVYAKFRSVADEKALGLDLELPDDQELPPVFANADRVAQILFIFLDNASKFTPAGGLLCLGARLSADEEFVELFVRDSGQGIASEDLEHIFERFYKADKSRGSKGTGLGLSIAREIAEHTGERVFVESEMGQGSTFYLALPTHDPRELAENS